MAPISQTDKDIPAVLALLILGFFLVVLLYFNSPGQVLFWQKQLAFYLQTHVEFVIGLIASLSINAIALGSVLARSFGLSQQGSRLAILSRRHVKKDDPGKLSLIQLLFIGSVGVLIFGALWNLRFPDLSTLASLPLNDEIKGIFLSIARLSFAMNGSVFTFIFSRIVTWKGLKVGFLKGLPHFPSPKNGIVVGSAFDLEPHSKPEWVTLNRRALNGNILVTGSIGTGKTQGTILTFFDQILSNFDPHPSVLAIDPKGTFIPEALQMIKRHGLEKHVLHLKLGGDVTFNPILSLTPLKEAQFMDTTQMIRAAAMNFHGRSSDSGFWETLAFNLKKNTLAYCAAKLEGKPFTLNDIYREMIEACQDTLRVSDALMDFSKEDRFDDEEKFNLVCASNYFKEFDQFDAKVKTGVLATATSFLNQFQEYRASQIFCPDPKNLVIKTMDDVVDQGKILLFDISSPALARSMGTFVKLHYEQSVLNRLVARNRGKERTAVIIADEYQDVVSTGGGATIGDDRFCAKSREANALAIFATQSLTSLKNSVGKEDSAKELVQNFRTMISGHSTDLMTIRYFQELMGQEEKERVSHSVSENAQRPNRNLVLGGFEVKDANISESISTSQQKEYTVTGKEFSTLSSFETFARIYDGNGTYFRKLYLKPYFLEKKNTLHGNVLKLLKAAACITVAFLSLKSTPSYAFPNVCTVVKTPEFNSCLNFGVGPCMCGFPPRPCAQFTYYVPQTFIEVFPDSKESFFSDYPGTALQLAMVSRKDYGAEADNDTQSFQAHAMSVPLAFIPFETMPCRSERVNSFCFEGMSEHLGDNWENGLGDSLQPNFLAWSLNPKACILKGAAESLSGELIGIPGLPTVPACSFPRSFIPKYPPSAHTACNGWGIFYPRGGTYNGGSQTIGALMIASRLKSLGNEIFNTVPSGVDDLWQMITPQSSSCFKEGQNVQILETIKQVREERRLITQQHKGYLFTVWNKVTCCRDLAEIPTAIAAIAAMNIVCQGLGSL